MFAQAVALTRRNPPKYPSGKQTRNPRTHRDRMLTGLARKRLDRDRCLPKTNLRSRGTSRRRVDAGSVSLAGMPADHAHRPLAPTARRGVAATRKWRHC